MTSKSHQCGTCNQYRDANGHGDDCDEGGGYDEGNVSDEKYDQMMMVTAITDNAD